MRESGEVSGLVLGVVGKELREIAWGLVYTHDYISLCMLAWAVTCQYTQSILV